MTEVGHECAAAQQQLSTALRASSRFPNNVFAGDWIGYLFFDSDWIFESGFVAKAIMLLDSEGGSCARLSNLDRADEDGAVFSIDHSTTSDDYQRLLHEGVSGLRWNFTIDRFACISDLGRWCIYCERPNEIAVMAFRPGARLERYAQVVGALRAAPIEAAIGQSISWGFSARGLSPLWRTELLRHYGTT
jgi:hypothetical protein